MILTTTRLTIRELTPADEDHLVDLDADPAVMAYLTGGRATARAEVRGVHLPYWFAYYREHPGFGRWAALVNAEFAGWFALTSEGVGVADLGYRLRRTFWGRGLATEGSAALITYGFDDLALSRITAQTMAINLRSRAVMVRLGMRLLRTWHEHFEDPVPGAEYGEVEYAVDSPVTVS